MNDDYKRNCDLVRVVDGDTVDLRVDLGYNVAVTERIRLGGIDCPEMRGENKEAGKAAKAFAARWFAATTEHYVLTVKNKKGKYGRYIGGIYGSSGEVLECLNEELVVAGHATQSNK